MSSPRLNLSNKLDGGYLHVKKRFTNIKKKTSKGGGYSDYLNKTQGSGALKLGGGADSGCTSTDSKRKIVSIKLGGNRSPRKKKVIKGIPNITPQKKGPVQKPVQNKRGVPIKLPTTQGSLRKHRVIRRSNAKIRGIKNSLTKRSNQAIKRGKRISVTKTRTLSNKDVSRIQSRLKSIKNKSSEEIKQELNKQGFQLSGKSPAILKDIYMYSQLCGINIKRE